MNQKISPKDADFRGDFRCWHEETFINSAEAPQKFQPESYSSGTMRLVVRTLLIRQATGTFLKKQSG